MITINEHYTKLTKSYLFVDIAKRVRAFQEAHPDTEVIKLGIGDVTRPLPAVAVDALHTAADEMADTETFRGYGPEQGYDFLRNAIAEHDYGGRGVEIPAADIFVSDGSKCDTGNFQELFAQAQTVAVTDPVYPVYVDTNVMAGRTGSFTDGRYEGIVYLEGNRENGFVPPPPDQPVDLLYLCFPNNPTGSTATREELTAYVEFRSFSKTAGFTGLRCAFTVVPHQIEVQDGSGATHRLRDLWMRRHTTKFNGASYPIQRAAAAIYSPEGRREVKELNDYYLENARIIRDGVNAIGLTSYGGVNSPYVWVDAGGRDSWELFDELLNSAGVVTTPGAGFGPAGEGFIRISAFNDRDKVTTAMERITTALA